MEKFLKLTLLLTRFISQDSKCLKQTRGEAQVYSTSAGCGGLASLRYRSPLLHVTPETAEEKKKERKQAVTAERKVKNFVFKKISKYKSRKSNFKVTFKTFDSNMHVKQKRNNEHAKVENDPLVVGCRSGHEAPPPPPAPPPP